MLWEPLQTSIRSSRRGESCSDSSPVHSDREEAVFFPIHRWRFSPCSALLVNSVIRIAPKSSTTGCPDRQPLLTDSPGRLSNPKSGVFKHPVSLLWNLSLLLRHISAPTSRNVCSPIAGSASRSSPLTLFFPGNWVSHTARYGASFAA